MGRCNNSDSAWGTLMELKTASSRNGWQEEAPWLKKCLSQSCTQWVICRRLQTKKLCSTEAWGIKGETTLNSLLVQLVMCYFSPQLWEISAFSCTDDAAVHLSCQSEAQRTPGHSLSIDCLDKALLIADSTLKPTFCLPQSKPLIPLQKEEDPETHKTVLTNYMFPQQTRTEDCEYCLFNETQFLFYILSLLLWQTLKLKNVFNLFSLILSRSYACYLYSKYEHKNMK